MSQLAVITPVEGSDLPGFGGGIPNRPGIAPPIHIPPLPPGIKPPETWPPPLEIGGGPVYPISIPETPDNSLPTQPGRIWPPLNPSDGVQGKVLLLVWVVGTDRYRWVVVEAPTFLSLAPNQKPKRFLLCPKF